MLDPMKAKTSADYQRAYRKRLRDEGLVKKEVWIRPEHSKRLSQFEKLLRKPGETSVPDREDLMANETIAWTTQTLNAALQQSPLVNESEVSLSLIEGVDPVILLVMHEFGDLPLFVTVSGEQILVECELWPQSAVKNVAEFNDAVLKSHKFFPLSTISLEATVSGESVYFMFGALSNASLLSSVMTEIRTLAANVIQATEAYESYLIELEIA